MGTASLSSDTVGPGQYCNASKLVVAIHDVLVVTVSLRVSIPPPSSRTASQSSLTTIVIAVSVVVVLIVAMVLATVTIIATLALKSRRSATLDLTKESRLMSTVGPSL